MLAKGHGPCDTALTGFLVVCMFVNGKNVNAYVVLSLAMHFMPSLLDVTELSLHLYWASVFIRTFVCPLNVNTSHIGCNASNPAIEPSSIINNHMLKPIKAASKFSFQH